jgi:hypothetical protein
MALLPEEEFRVTFREKYSFFEEMFEIFIMHNMKHIQIIIDECEFDEYQYFEVAKDNFICSFCDLALSSDGLYFPNAVFDILLA